MHRVWTKFWDLQKHVVSHQRLPFQNACILRGLRENLQEQDTHAGTLEEGPRWKVNLRPLWGSGGNLHFYPIPFLIHLNTYLHLNHLSRLRTWRSTWAVCTLRKRTSRLTATSVEKASLLSGDWGITWTFISIWSHLSAGKIFIKNAMKIAYLPTNLFFSREGCDMAYNDRSNR